MKSRNTDPKAQGEQAKIKNYKSQIKELVKEFNLVDANTQVEFDLAIHDYALKIKTAQLRISYSKN